MVSLQWIRGRLALEVTGLLVGDREPARVAAAAVDPDEPGAQGYFGPDSATWLIHAVWSYSFRNIIELLASGPERDAAAALGARRRRLGHGGSHA